MFFILDYLEHLNFHEFFMKMYHFFGVFRLGQGNPPPPCMKIFLTLAKVWYIYLPRQISTKLMLTHTMLHFRLTSVLHHLPQWLLHKCWGRFSPWPDLGSSILAWIQGFHCLQGVSLPAHYLEENEQRIWWRGLFSLIKFFVLLLIHPRERGCWLAREIVSIIVTAMDRFISGDSEIEIPFCFGTIAICVQSVHCSSW